MATLTTDDRRTFPKDDLALPEQRRLPIGDAAHVRNAKARAARSERVWTLSKADRKRFDAGADAVLGKG